MLSEHKQIWAAENCTLFLNYITKWLEQIYDSVLKPNLSFQDKEYIIFG